MPLTYGYIVLYLYLTICVAVFGIVLNLGRYLPQFKINSFSEFGIACFFTLFPIVNIFILGYFIMALMTYKSYQTRLLLIDAQVETYLKNKSVTRS